MDQKPKHSLVDVTRDFLNLLMNANGEEVDLAPAARALGATQRRLYDVTNVLSGVGIIKRCGKARVKWVGHTQPVRTGRSLADLRAQEAELDHLMAVIDDSFASLITSEELQEFGWLGQEEVERLGNGEMSIFALRGPSDMQIDVAEEDESVGHLLTCTSESGDVELIPILEVGK
jgi:hypothetical protein